MNTPAWPIIEPVEGRRLMSVVLNGTLLYVEGTSRADTITLQARPHQQGVDDGFDVTVYVAGAVVESSTYATKDVSRIVVRANPLRDVFRADPTLPVPVSFVSDAASGVTLVGGVLAVQGGKGSDVVRVYRNRGQADDITVVLNGQESRYSSAVAKALLIVGNRGDDDIAVGKVGLPQMVFGGDGDDLLTGGREADYFSGQLGDDTLLGGAGDDQLFGDDEADHIEGGDGDDRITAEGFATVLGGAGDDSLFVNVGNGVRFTGGAGHDDLRAAGPRDDIFLDFDPQEDTYLRLH